MHKLVLFLLLAVTCWGQAKFSPGVRPYVKVDGPTIALTHVRVIDGTGAPPREDQTIVISGGKIESVAASSSSPPANAQVLDLAGYTVIPGLVGMHNHLFYTAWINPDRNEGTGFVLNQQSFSFPKLYLAAGVTSMRTTGSIEPYADLNLKRLIDTGKIPGPKVHVTGPYLEGKGSVGPQLHELTGPDDTTRMVNYWADQGVTSFKAYINITGKDLAAAIKAAHKRKIKVTGHLCSVGFIEAAELGIDNLEHGFAVNTEFNAAKKPDQCPANAFASLANVEVNGEKVKKTIDVLVRRGVAITSTLAIFEQFVKGRSAPPQRVLDAMLPESRASCLARRAALEAQQTDSFAAIFRKEMQLELAFARAGGVLVAGPDPTGNGCVLAGFGDQRQVELLVEAGFTPVEAIKIATLNGAQYLGEAERIGSIAPGKQADLVVIKGDPSKDINDIEKVEIVFKDGVGYDSAKLIEAVSGRAGLQ